MNSAVVLTNTLEMESIDVSHSRWENSYINDSFRGYPQTSFGYIVKGTVDLYTRSECLHLSAGTLFLVPEKMRYRSEWHGSPEIEYFSIHSRSRSFIISEERYQLQTVPAFSGSETEMLFRRIYALYESGTQADRIRALGLYCIFFADVLPYLQKSEPSKMHPVLSDALSFLWGNFRRNFTVEELAAYCNISVSHLHHLFIEELHTTPIRYRNKIRIDWAVQELTRTTQTIDQIAEACGFSSTIYFREIFKSFTGRSPTAYRRETVHNTFI